MRIITCGIWLKKGDFSNRDEESAAEAEYSDTNKTSTNTLKWQYLTTNNR